jgi:hypothetical protein
VAPAAPATDFSIAAFSASASGVRASVKVLIFASTEAFINPTSFASASSLEASAAYLEEKRK